MVRILDDGVQRAGGSKAKFISPKLEIEIKAEDMKVMIGVRDQNSYN